MPSLSFSGFVVFFFFFFVVTMFLLFFTFFPNLGEFGEDLCNCFLNREGEGCDLEFHFLLTGTTLGFYFQIYERREGWCAQFPVQFSISGSPSSSGPALLWLNVRFRTLLADFLVSHLSARQCRTLRSALIGQLCGQVLLALPSLLESTPGIPHSPASALCRLLVLPVLFMLLAVIWNLRLGEQLQTSISERGSLSQSLWLS